MKKQLFLGFVLMSGVVGLHGEFNISGGMINNNNPNSYLTNKTLIDQSLKPAALKHKIAAQKQLDLAMKAKTAANALDMYNRTKLEYAYATREQATSEGFFSTIGTFDHTLDYGAQD